MAKDIEHGTHNGYEQHLRRPTDDPEHDPCADCTEANRVYKDAWRTRKYGYQSTPKKQPPTQPKPPLEIVPPPAPREMGPVESAYAETCMRLDPMNRYPDLVASALAMGRVQDGPSIPSHASAARQATAIIERLRELTATKRSNKLTNIAKLSQRQTTGTATG